MGFLDAPITPATATALANKVAKGELLVNIADYGPVGDGLADDQPAFQNAMNYLQSQGGGTLILQRGKKYRVSKSVQCADNTLVMGNGATMCKLDATDFQYAIFQTRQGMGPGYGASLKNFTVRGLNFTSDYSKHRSACAFAANHAQNVLFDDCTFIQFQGAGHSFDLCGSDTITITNCVWRGFDNLGSGTTPDAECIQIDNSLNGALSNSESSGSFDALPTINVTISNNKFLPLTVGGIDYPCPNPLGIHSRREGAWHTNIIFENNLIVDPVTDTTSNYRGTIHLIASAGVQIIGNTWQVSSGKAAQASRAIGIYSFNTGQLASSDPGDSTNSALVAISPMNCYAIRIERNRFVGFNNTSTDANMINLVGQSGNAIEDVTIRDNSFRDCAVAGGDGSLYGINIYANYVNNLKVNGNSAKNVKQFAYVNNSTNVAITDNYLYGTLTYPIYCNVITDLSITNLSIDTCNLGLLLFSITYLTISGMHSKNPVHTTSAQAIGIKDSTYVLVTGCILNRATAVTGSTGVLVYGTSDVGYVRNNVITGYASKATNSGTGTNVTIIDNL